VLTAACSDDALRTVAERTGPLHLVLADLVLPRGSGYGLAEGMAAVRPDPKVLVTSGNAQEVPRGVWFLPRPFMPEGLAAMVRLVLAGRSAGT